MENSRQLYHDMTESELVQAICNEDKKAFNELILRYGVFVMGRARKLSGNEEHAAEIFQNVFFNIYKKIHTFEAKSSLRTWIAAIAYNEWRLLARISDSSATELDDDTTNYSSSHADDIIDVLEYKEAYEHISEAIKQLPENYRSALVGYAVDDKSYADIARELGVTEGQVKVWIFRARQKLKDLLEGYL